MYAAAVGITVIAVLSQGTLTVVHQDTLWPVLRDLVTRDRITDNLCRVGVFAELQGKVKAMQKAVARGDGFNGAAAAVTVADMAQDLWIVYGELLSSALEGLESSGALASLRPALSDAAWRYQVQCGAVAPDDVTTVAESLMTTMQAAVTAMGIVAVSAPRR